MHFVNALQQKPGFWLVFAALLFGGQSIGRTADVAEAPEKPVSAAGVHGGLCVQIGGEQGPFAVPLANTGRYLVHWLCCDPETVAEARRRLSRQGDYGLLSVDPWDAEGNLPYAEDLVDLLVILDGQPPALDEAKRVLAPSGVMLVSPSVMTPDQLRAAGMTDVRTIRSGRQWLAGRKPWPPDMDEWTHSRHSAGGNAVSSDTRVGPPRRVRWVVGAQSEVPGLVSSGGRNFYAGVLARNGFNGLRLWARDLVEPSAGGVFVMKRLPASMPAPVAAGKCLFACEAGKLLAIDSATGRTIRQYPEADRPRFLLHDEGALVVADEGSLRVLEAETGRLLWRQDALEPRCIVAGGGCVGLVQGRSRRGERTEISVLDKAAGKVRWQRNDLPWIERVTACVYHRGVLAYEVSSLSDDAPGNAIHVVSAADGKVVWEREFPPGMNHRRQARAMFVGDRLWILHGGKDAEKNRLPVQCSAIDPRTGEVQATHNAGLVHCFPPVATTRYLLSGEMDFTDLLTGEIDANRITKAACSGDHGWVPANGLVYVTPKHCVCWPMLRGYAALAPERPGGGDADRDVQDIDFVVERGVEPLAGVPVEDADAWPCYRHDAWRSGGTPAPGPSQLNTLWSADLGACRMNSPIVDDWRENPFVKGPITAPVIANGVVYVARPDFHEVVAMDASSGRVRWRFTANGRVDTPPTIHRGLCLFGAKSGWVYCLRGDDGRLVWRLRAAPLDERIIAYGQLESPWPVPGSVLAVDDTVYFAAGRQSLAEGGILVFAVAPSNGAIRWVKRLDSVPQQGFYECSALEFDNFDLLHREGDGVAMSRWVFDRTNGEMSIDRWSAFAKLNTGRGAVMVPQGCWSYAPRHQRRIGSYTPNRPLVVFRDNRLWGCMQGMRAVYRRDFDLEGGETFDAKWMTGWAASQLSREGKMPWRSHRLAENAKWLIDVYDEKDSGQTIAAMTLAGDRLFLGGDRGDLQVRSAGDGKLLDKRDVPAPLWDGVAVASGRLYVSTTDGRLLCLGE